MKTLDTLTLKRIITIRKRILKNTLKNNTMSSTPVWFITGAGTGFGQAIALEALAPNHKVVATARRLPTLAPLEAAGASVLELDVTASEGVIEAKVKEAHDIHGRLTYVVNAAGYVLEGAVEEAS